MHRDKNCIRVAIFIALACIASATGVIPRVWGEHPLAAPGVTSLTDR